jgi:NtrC-family two-component system response regulator AlgB
MAETVRTAASLSVLVVDDEINIRKTLSLCLESQGHKVVGVTNLTDALGEAKRRSFDLAFVDLRLGTESGMDLIPALLVDSPWLKIVVITAYAAVDSAVEAMRRGATDYLPKPFTPVQVSAIADKVARLRALEQRVHDLESAIDESKADVAFLTGSLPMQRALSFAQQVAQSDATILLRGESGTGKGVLARAIHSWSPRATKPFTVVACPSLSPELLESELFGHVKGAFTGALRDSPGRVSLAEGGTLFLDEIGELPLGLQPKLLRFVQDHEYERVGDGVTRRADLRVIAATNSNLEDSVKNGRFREDLFYRINVVQIEIPPLRERREDVVPLAEWFLASLGRRKKVLGYTEDASSALQSYAWPGNVRELRNVIERALILCQGERIGPEHLPETFSPRPAPAQLGDLVTLSQIEEMHIRRVLASTKSLEEAARVLGIDPATLWRRRKEYGI